MDPKCTVSHFFFLSWQVASLSNDNASSVEFCQFSMQQDVFEVKEGISFLKRIKLT